MVKTTGVNNDNTVFGILDRIVQQVMQYLSQPQGVALDPVRNIGIDIANQLEPLIERLGRQYAGDILDYLGQVDAFRFDKKAACLKAMIAAGLSFSMRINTIPLILELHNTEI